MIYGYARVSTDAQDLANQLAQLRAAGCEEVFRERITGTTADRPQLQKLIKVLAPGDVVITPAVDRLSRDATDLLLIARDMRRAGRHNAQRGAQLQCQSEHDFTALDLIWRSAAHCRQVIPSFPLLSVNSLPTGNGAISLTDWKPHIGRSLNAGKVLSSTPTPATCGEALLQAAWYSSKFFFIVPNAFSQGPAFSFFTATFMLLLSVSEDTLKRQLYWDIYVIV